MTTKVTRYNYTGNHEELAMRLEPDGDWVHAWDYEELEAKVAEQAGEIERLRTQLHKSIEDGDHLRSRWELAEQGRAVGENLPWKEKCTAAEATIKRLREHATAGIFCRMCDRLLDHHHVDCPVAALNLQEKP